MSKNDITVYIVHKVKCTQKHISKLHLQYDCICNWEQFKAAPINTPVGVAVDYSKQHIIDQHIIEETMVGIADYY